MIKRYFSIYLAGVFVFISAFALFPTSASAAESDSELQKIDVLSYDYPDDSTSVRIYTYVDRPYNVFKLPFSYGLYYFDVIFECPVPVTSVGVRSVTSGSVYSLTLASLGNNRYRAYGSTSTAFNSAEFAFQIVGNTSVGYTITYYKFDVYTTVNVGVGDLGEMQVTPDADTPFDGVWRRQSSVNTPLFTNFYNYGSVQFTQYSVNLSSVNWRKFDYVDFSFELRAADIYNISAYVDTSNGSRFLPFDISWGDGDAIDRNEYIASGSASNIVAAQNNYFVVMRVYIDRASTLDGALKINLGGNYASTASGIMLDSVMGYYYTSVPSPDLVKLDQITQAIKESLSSSESDNAAAEDFSSSIESSSESFSSNLSELQSVQKPSLEAFNSMIDPNTLIDSNGIALLVSTFLPITDSPMVLSIMMLSCTFGVISFCLFGKKG